MTCSLNGILGMNWLPFKVSKKAQGKPKKVTEDQTQYNSTCIKFKNTENQTTYWLETDM